MAGNFKNGQRQNGGRKGMYQELHRTALFNKSWDFLHTEFEETKDKKYKMEIVKMLMPAMIKTIPQENINKNENTDVVNFGKDEKELLKGVIEIFKSKLRKNE